MMPTIELTSGFVETPTQQEWEKLKKTMQNYWIENQKLDLHDQVLESLRKKIQDLRIENETLDLHNQVLEAEKKKNPKKENIESNSGQPSDSLCFQLEFPVHFLWMLFLCIQLEVLVFYIIRDIHLFTIFSEAFWSFENWCIFGSFVFGFFLFGFWFPQLYYQLRGLDIDSAFI